MFIILHDNIISLFDILTGEYLSSLVSRNRSRKSALVADGQKLLVMDQSDSIILYNFNILDVTKPVQIVIVEPGITTVEKTTTKFIPASQLIRYCMTEI